MVSGRRVTIPDVKKDIEPKPSPLLFVAAFAALLGGWGLGCTVSYSSPAIIDMTRNDSNPRVDPDDLDTKSWIGSATTLGALVGGMLGGPASSMLGRKLALIVYGIPFTVGWLLIGFAQNVYYIFAGRALTGICCGLICGTVPTYVCEISTPKTRGIFGCGFGLFITMGVLMTTVVGNYLSWDELAMVSALPGALMSLLMFFMPESPQYLCVKQGRLQASMALEKLRAKGTNVQSELDQMEDEVFGDQDSDDFEAGGSCFSKLAQPDTYKPLTFALALMFFQQMSGINAVLFYQKAIFRSASESIDLNMATISVALAQVVTVLVESAIVDRLGRRILLIISGTGITITLGGLGFYYFMKERDPTGFAIQYSWLPLVCLLGFIITFNLAYAPIPWMMIPEMTPSHARNLVVGAATTFSWGMAFIVTKYFEPVCKILQPYGCWWLFAGTTAAGVIFLLILLPETSGKSLQQIQKRYAKGWKNSLFVAVSNRKQSLAARRASSRYSNSMRGSGQMASANGYKIRPSLVNYKSSPDGTPEYE